MTANVSSFSQAAILEELQNHLATDGMWPKIEHAGTAPQLLADLVVDDYAPGLGPSPCPSQAEALRRLSTWLHYEFTNRLDAPQPALVAEAIRQSGALVGTNLGGKSRAEIRAAIEQILRRSGFPPLSPTFVAHNARVDAMCCQAIASVQRTWHRRPLSAWLHCAAAANLLEIWPMMSPQSARDCSVWRSAASEGHVAAFIPLAEQLTRKLRSRGPLGLFTDNHGETVVDLAFLTWLQHHHPCKVFLFPKACPVETDIDTYGVEAIRHRFPALQATIVPGGSRIQGNLLTTLGQEFCEALREIKAEEGVILVKGLANLETVPGLLIDALFLLAAKTATVAQELGVPHGTAVGLWVPAGKRLHDPACLVACVPSTEVQ